MPSTRRHRRPHATLAALALTCAVAMTACSAEAGDDDAAAASTFPDRGDLTNVALEIAGGATAVTVVTGDTDGALFRTAGTSIEATTTESGPGRYELDFTVPDGSADSAVTVHLDPDVVWHLTFTGGSRTLTADLSAATLSGIDFATGVETFDLTLPAPTGAVPVNQAGGASVFAVHLPADAPATVSFEQGVGAATLDGTALDAAASTTTVGDDAAEDRFVITNSGGLATFTLDRS